MRARLLDYIHNQDQRGYDAGTAAYTAAEAQFTATPQWPNVQPQAQPTQAWPNAEPQWPNAEPQWPNAEPQWPNAQPQAAPTNMPAAFYPTTNDFAWPVVAQPAVVARTPVVAPAAAILMAQQHEEAQLEATLCPYRESPSCAFACTLNDIREGCEPPAFGTLFKWGAPQRGPTCEWCGAYDRDALTCSRAYMVDPWEAAAAVLRR